MGDPWTNNEEQVRCEARTDREQCRSSAPCDLREPHRQDETRRTVDLGHSSDGPSWIDLAAIRVNTTESRFEASLNRLLQHGVIPGSSQTKAWESALQERMRPASCGLATMESDDGILCRTGRVVGADINLCGGSGRDGRARGRGRL